MESIIARALEYTLKYWLKSFSRDQFKLQGRTGQLSNLDIDGDALHASLGLPPALHVVTARVGKLEITLPSVSNVQVEPIVVQIDRLDLVLEEKEHSEELKIPGSSQSPATSPKGSGYGYSDKIADGMTVHVGIVNLLLETHGSSRHEGGATWSPPLSSITIRGLTLYTTNENWQVVNLKEARDFSNNKGYIYVFKKLEWESLSVDLLPHPDMFADARYNSPSNRDNKRDDDGAKRLFFGGERFLEGISGEASITLKRTELNDPLGLEVQLHIPEAVCPALSEPGLRAFLRFMTGLVVCLGRGDLGPKEKQKNTEAPGVSSVSILVDHIFICIKDSEFQLELLMQSLFFNRESVSDGKITRNLTSVKVGGFFLRDTFCRPPCTLIQPSMQSNTKESSSFVPEFGKNFSPPIHPLGNQLLQYVVGVPLLCFYSLQNSPSPAPPKFASQTVVTCQPVIITLQENSCLRISSLLADGVMVGSGTVLSDFSVNSLDIRLEEFDLSIPLNPTEMESCLGNGEHCSESSFSGAKLRVRNLYLCQSPSAKCKLLNLDKDPACFSLWEYQPIDASQRKWVLGASELSISLETRNKPSDLWKCVQLYDACFEAAMVTADGGPLIEVPPPDGIVRIGVACQHYVSNTSVEQLFFVLSLYSYFDQVGEKISNVTKSLDKGSSTKTQVKKFPSDTAVSLCVNNLDLTFLETSTVDIQGTPLVKYSGEDLFVRVSHRTLGGAFTVSTDLLWRAVRVSCSNQNGEVILENGIGLLTENNIARMRDVFWVDNTMPAQFLDIRTVHVVPYSAEDLEFHSLNVSAKICGVRLGGGMRYTESLLHQFGVLGPDGGPGEGLLKGLRDLSSGPVGKLFKSSSMIKNDGRHLVEVEQGDKKQLDLGIPDNLDVSIELKNWLFALEGTEEVCDDRFSVGDGNIISREEKCWHTTFGNLRVAGKSKDGHRAVDGGIAGTKKIFPLESLTAGIEDLQAIKPRRKDNAILLDSQRASNATAANEAFSETGGVDIETLLVISQDDESESVKWALENIKFAVKQPIEAVVAKEELEHLSVLFKSEADAMGRMAAAILRILKLEESLGKATINQLSNLGSEGFDGVLTPKRPGQRSSVSSGGFTPRTSTSNANSDDLGVSMEATITLLEIEISDSQAKCAALASEMEAAGDSKCSAEIIQLNQKLEGMQNLLTRIRTLI